MPRNFLKYILAFLLVISISLTMLSYTFSELTKHENALPFFSGLIADRLSKEASAEEMQKISDGIRDECQGKKETTIDLENRSIKINCSEIGRKPIQNIMAESMFNYFYYKDYSCKIAECFGEPENLPVVFSQQMNEKYKSSFQFLIFLSLTLAVILLLVAKGIESKIRTLGSCLLVSGLGFIPFAFLMVFTQIKLPIISRILAIFLALFIGGVLLLVLARFLKGGPEKSIQQ